MTTSVTVQGLEEAIAGISRLLQSRTALDSVLKSSAEKMRTLVSGNTPVGIGRTSGNLKSSWTIPAKADGGFSFQNAVPYAYVVERGLYRGAGPRTVQTSDGVFSRQAPQGMTVVIDDETATGIVTFVANELMRLARG